MTLFLYQPLDSVVPAPAGGAPVTSVVRLLHLNAACVLDPWVSLTKLTHQVISSGQHLPWFLGCISN